MLGFADVPKGEVGWLAVRTRRCMLGVKCDAPPAPAVAGAWPGVLIEAEDMAEGFAET